MSSRKISSEDILDFWFSDEVAKRWFKSAPEFDNELRDKFESLYLDAKNGDYDHWLETPNGCLALVILFDQLPLNIYRGKQQSFATEARAREVANHAISQSFDEEMTEKQKIFIYMPFMHSENLADQDRSIELYEKAGLKENLRFARHHRELIKRFGRFPHRNRVLGRQSTQAEREYLASKEAFHG
ncbi:MAG: DUF924 family protein [Thioalkalispiraceae bacterium]|jgi:uncharacterized protein (DUF924 family)